MTSVHLRPLLDAPADLHLFFKAAEQFVQASLPEPILEGIRLGRLTALQKPQGGVRGGVVGDIVRRLVAKTMAQQLGPAVEASTSPFQYAMTTCAGCECVALQALSESDPEATIVSVDGVSAFDLISRGAIVEGLRQVNDAALPFVRMFYGRPSIYLWELADGTVHHTQGEGGEQGDPLMPLLFSLGQHPALIAAQARRLPNRVAQVCALLQEELWRHSRIRIHGGKTQGVEHVWDKTCRLRPP